MRITPVNNQRQNNMQNQTSFTALRKINVIGMTEKEKKVIMESLDEIKEVAKQVENMDISLTDVIGHRSFRALAYNNPTKPSDVFILDGATSGNPHIMDINSKEDWIKTSLSNIVNSARDNYFKMFPEKIPAELPVYSMKGSNNAFSHGSKTLL